MNMQETGCPWDGLKSQVPALRLCVLEIKQTHFRWTTLPRSVSPQENYGHVPWWTWLWVWDRSSICLWVFSAWGCIPKALPATGAAWESLNPLWTHSAAFLKGPKCCASADDSPEMRQGAALSSSLQQQRGGTGEPARGCHGRWCFCPNQWGMHSHSMQCLWNLQQPHLTTAACFQKCL